MNGRPEAMALAACGALLLAGCAQSNRATSAQNTRQTEPVKLRLHLASTNEQEDYRETADENGLPLYVAPQPFVTEADVWNAALFSSRKRNLVELELTHGAAVELERVSRAHIGQRLAIFIDDQLVVSPFLSSPITKGKAYVDGQFSPARAEELVRALNAQRAARGPVSGSQDR